jgi:regulator of nucleoside diphosphate kinase
MNDTNTTTTLPVLRISRTDHERVRLLVEAMGNARPQLRESLQPLKRELERAEVLAPSDVPSNVVKMGSRIEIEDRETGEVDNYTLVYPEEADAAGGKISVLAPIGMAVIASPKATPLRGRRPAVSEGS